MRGRKSGAARRTRAFALAASLLLNGAVWWFMIAQVEPTPMRVEPEAVRVTLVEARRPPAPKPRRPAASPLPDRTISRAPAPSAGPPATEAAGVPEGAGLAPAKPVIDERWRLPEAVRRKDELRAGLRAARFRPMCFAQLEGVLNTEEKEACHRFWLGQKHRERWRVTGAGP